MSIHTCVSLPTNRPYKMPKTLAEEVVRKIGKLFISNRGNQRIGAGDHKMSFPKIGK